MALNRVWILTAGFGEGHNAAARNLAEALRKALPDATIEIEDVFLEVYGPLNQLARKSYIWLINHFPSLWNVLFQWLDRSTVVADRVGILGKAAGRMRRRLDEIDPDLVVTTYPAYNHLLDQLFRCREDRRFLHVTVVTDSITINSVWLTGHSDFWLVANDATARVVVAKGVPQSRVRITGFPVPGIFCELECPKSRPGVGELWQILFMVNSGKRIALESVRKLLKIDGVQLTVTVGKDEVLHRKIEALLKTESSKVRLYGWTEKLPELIARSHLVVSKAGGATSQECLAGRTPMIVSQVVPGQEEGNARLIEQSRAGCLADTPEKIASAVRSAIANDGALWNEWQKAASALSRPCASREIAKWLTDLTVTR